MAELVSALPHLTLGLQAEVIIGSVPGGTTEKLCPPNRDVTFSAI